MVIVWWVVGGVVAVLDWYAVATHRARLETVAKPATMLALLAAAVAMGAPGSAAGWWLLAALALGLAGDILLLGKTEPRFLGGLGAFLLGHLGYVVAFVVLGLDRPAWVLLGLLAFGIGLVPARWVLVATHRDGGPALAGPVAAYIVVIGAMVCAAWATGHPLVGIGATVFLASDTMLALDRFVTPRRWAGTAVMVTYHVGQSLVVLGVLAAAGVAHG